MKKQPLYIPIPEKKDWQKAKNLAKKPIQKPLSWLDRQAEKAINKMAQKALEKLAKHAASK